MNTAQKIMQLTTVKDNDGANWPIVGMAYGGVEHKAKRRGLWKLSGHRFADGSALTYDDDGMPHEFIGSFADEV